MKKESSVLKYTAILMIVFGAVETAIGIRGLFDISALHDAALALQLANPVPTLIISGVFTLLIAAAELIAGILGCLYRARPKKAGVCILSGIAKWFAPEDLIGKKIGIVANLAPRPMMKGKYVSEGMIFAADTDVDGGCSIAFFPDSTPAGACIH